jgi:dolichyl-phosphate-mannose--protein O-mannosyl transferase
MKKKKLLSNYRLILVCILFFAFTTRVARLYYPNNYYFDEVYHAVTANLIAQNDPRAYEWWHQLENKNTAIDWLHPPLAKYSQAFFINLFGFNSFSWRISSAIFGTGVILLVYLLANQLFNDKRLALLSSLLASFDGLLLTQSRIAMNDIHVTFFILLTSWFYIKFIKVKKEKLIWLTGLSAGLAIATKWSGLLSLALIILIECFRLSFNLLKKKSSYLKTGITFIKRLLSLIFLPSLIYLASYWQMFFQGKNIKYFLKLHQQIINYQTTLKATHPYQSMPWEWVLDLKPVWFFVDYINQATIANIYAFGNPALFWIGTLTVLISLIYLTWQLLVAKKKSQHPQEFLMLIVLILFYFSTWLPWIFSPRIMFIYHYTPAVAFLSILISFWLIKLLKTNNTKLKNKKNAIVYSIIFIIGATFIVWYPHWVGIAVPKMFAQKIYFALPVWK